MKVLEEFKKAFYQAKKHWQQILFYSKSRCLINAKDFDVIILFCNYYNFIRKEIFNKFKLRIIDMLLIIFKKNSFIFRICVNIEKDKQNVVIFRKLI